MAEDRIAKTISNPRARYWFKRDRKISNPKPFKTIIEAITSIGKAIIIVWFTPAKEVVSARGICTVFNF